MSKYLNKLIKSSKNEDARIVEEGLPGSDIKGYINTGCYALNAVLSGSIFGGLPNNKITAFAGEPSTGKTYFAISIIKQFLQENPEGVVVYFDSEQAVTSDMFKQRNIPTDRIAVLPVGTVEDFRTQAFRIIDEVLAEPEADRKPMIIVLDSLGMLSTEKQLSDVAEGKNVRDMTKAQLVKGAFVALTLKAGKAGVPILVTNHTYNTIGTYVPTKEMCLVAGTKIMTPDGEKEIQTLEVNDLVLTLDGVSSISECHEFVAADLFEIEFEDGEKITCTEDHKFLVDGKWVSAGTLQEMAQNTKSLNIDVASIKDGKTDVFRQQIHKNLF